MRLFEVQDLGAVRAELSVRQGLANSNPDKAKRYSTIPPEAVRGILAKHDIALPPTEQGLIALKNAMDPQGDVIDRIGPDGSIILKTQGQNPNQEKPLDIPKGKTVDQMADRANNKLQPDL